MKFEIYQDTARYWRWRLKAANGEVIASGEAYTTKSNCEYAVSLVKQSGTAQVIYL